MLTALLSEEGLEDSREPKESVIDLLDEQVGDHIELMLLTKINLPEENDGEFEK